MAAQTKQTYDVVADGWILGDYYKAGQTVELLPAQAKYDLPAHGGHMLRERVAPPATPASAPKKKPAAAAQD